MATSKSIAKSPAGRAARRSRANRRPSLDADKVLGDYRNRRAIFTSEGMEEYERAIAADNYRVTRRIALATLTRPCAEIIDSIKEDREVAVEFARASASMHMYTSLLRQLADAIEEADKRLVVALACREDMDAVIAEAANAGRGTRELSASEGTRGAPDNVDGPSTRAITEAGERFTLPESRAHRSATEPARSVDSIVESAFASAFNEAIRARAGDDVPLVTAVTEFMAAWHRVAIDRARNAGRMQ